MSFPAAQSAAIFLVGGAAVIEPRQQQQPGAAAAAAAAAENLAPQEFDGKVNWKNAQKIAMQFFDYLYSSDCPHYGNFDSVSRDTVDEMFEEFKKKKNISTPSKRQQKRYLQSLVMAALRRHKLMKTKKYKDTGDVVCHFARKDKTFPPIEERMTAQDQMKQKYLELHSDKNNIIITKDPEIVTTANNSREEDKQQQEHISNTLLPLNTTVLIHYDIIHRVDERLQLFDIVQLKNVQLSGPHKHRVKLFSPFDQNNNSVLLDEGSITHFILEVSTPNSTSVIRCNALFEFEGIISQKQVLWQKDQPQKEEKQTFSILRSLVIKVGKDPALYKQLQPTTPYTKQKKKQFVLPSERKKPSKDKESINKDVINPLPKDKNGKKDKKGSFSYKGLKQYKIPIDIREMIASGEIDTTTKEEDAGEDNYDDIIQKPTYNNIKNFRGGHDDDNNPYKVFWQQMLWISELQAYKDIQLFDIEKASLETRGGGKHHLFKLLVPGLAEGRPSILRDDIVICLWNNKEYRGRVTSVELSHILMEFHPSFHKKFDVKVDRVDLVRFTFSRTTFRTSHQGCSMALTTMTPQMLTPQPVHVKNLRNNIHQMTRRVIPNQFAWASRTLNEEQMNAVTEIAKGTLRPLPYIIFGPPGTGYVLFCVELDFSLYSFLPFLFSLFMFIVKQRQLSRLFISLHVYIHTTKAKGNSKYCWWLRVTMLRISLLKSYLRTSHHQKWYVS